MLALQLPAVAECNPVIYHRYTSHEILDPKPYKPKTLFRTGELPPKDEQILSDCWKSQQQPHRPTLKTVTALAEWVLCLLAAQEVRRRENLQTHRKAATMARAEIVSPVYLKQDSDNDTRQHLIQFRRAPVMQLTQRC